MKNFFKTLAVLIIIAHVAAGIFYAGIIPVSFFRNLRLPDAGRLAEFILRLQDESDEDEKTEGEESGPGENSLSENTDEESETGETAAAAESANDEKQQEPRGEEERIRIELSETLPTLEEKDLYDLVGVLRAAGALKAVDENGNDRSDQVICELAADINDPGRFTAVFSILAEDGQIERGPSAEMRVELTEPFLAFRQNEVTIAAGMDYNPYNNILICMDLNGTVLTEYVEYDGYLNTSQKGDYELRFYIYSRVNASSAFRNMVIHVVDR